MIGLVDSTELIQQHGHIVFSPDSAFALKAQREVEPELLDFDMWCLRASLSVLPLQYECDCSQDFQGQLHTYSLADVQIAYLQVSAHEVVRHAGMTDRYRNSVVFNFLLDGFCVSRQDGTVTRMQAGSSWFCHAARDYMLTFPEPFTLVSVVIPQEMIFLSVPGADLLASVDLSAGSRVACFVEMHLRQLVAGHGFTQTDLAERMARHTTDLLGTLIGEQLGARDYQMSQSQISILIRVKQQIMQHIGDPELSSQTVAEQTGVSVRYINQLLQQEGLSLSRLIWQSRLNRASQLLQRGSHHNSRISDIAFASGFNDMAHFSRAFKKQFGVPPSRYHFTYRNIQR